MLRPRAAFDSCLRHVWWRMKNCVRCQRQPEWIDVSRDGMGSRKPEKLRLSMLYRMAMARGRRWPEHDP